MKMSDTFKLPLFLCGHDKPSTLIRQRTPNGTATGMMNNHHYASLVVHAINGYDKLNEQNAEMRELIVEMAYKLNVCGNDLYYMIVLENMRLKKAITCTDETPPDYIDGQTCDEAFKLEAKANAFIERVK